MPDRVRGIVDLPLTPEGRREISLWANWFKARGGLDMVYHSSLIRDAETAKILAKPSRATLIDLGPVLFPQDQGDLSGLPKSSVIHAQNRLLARPEASGTGESLADAARRFLPAWNDILGMSKWQKVALVSHGSGIQLANAWTSAGAKRSLELNLPGLGLKVPVNSVMFVDPFNFLSLPPINLTLADLAPLSRGLFQVRHGRTAWSGL